jgi:hypothetical protein
VDVEARWYLDQVPGLRRVVAVANLDLPDRGEVGYGDSLPPVGLSTCHISPGLRSQVERLDPVRETVGVATVRVAHGGTVVRCALSGAAPAARLEQARRGAIVGYSRRAGRRLKDLVASVNQSKAGLPLFVTLTYPGRWAAEPERWKRDLDAFAKRLVRRVPGASFIWRLEFQRRGAPHYHLLVFGVSVLHRRWLSTTWADIVTDLTPAETLRALGDGGAALSAEHDMYCKHLAAGTQVQRVRSWRGVASYAAKGMAHELGKGDQAVATLEVGRWWGVVNRHALPVDIEVVVIALDVFWRLRRLLRRLGGRPGSGRWQGMAAFVTPPTVAVFTRWLGANI